MFRATRSRIVAEIGAIQLIFRELYSAQDDEDGNDSYYAHDPEIRNLSPAHQLRKNIPDIQWFTNEIFNTAKLLQHLYAFPTRLQEAARYVQDVKMPGLTSIASAGPTQFCNFAVLYVLAAEEIEVHETE